MRATASRWGFIPFGNLWSRVIPRLDYGLSILSHTLQLRDPSACAIQLVVAFLNVFDRFGVIRQHLL